ncbi:MAG: UDP-N-acetylmuramate--L-alanine ligase [Thermodesulfobacteriales bacterium]|nr:MAG: UDP-N-acetylmuramate--L-alanine ligase [Thermodesulfobacteriales bacterium]
MYGKIKRIHFVGIGGIGMSGIAEVLLNIGYEISGSDIGQSSTVKRLKDLGATITIGHSAENVEGAGVVVTSSAIKSDNPEVLRAKEINIPVIPRAEMLAELMRLRYGIAVAGSHGKTTTTSMTAAVLSYGKLDPTIVVGGKVKTMGTNARLGSGDFMVVEADESDGSFLKLSPVISVLTNIDEEHMDYYKNMDELENTFMAFLDKIPFYGLSVLCIDCPRIKELSNNFKKRFITYGFDKEAELRAQDVKISGFETKFDVYLNGADLGSVTLHVPGRHNAQNALAAIAIGMELGMSFEDTSKGLSEFRGIDRRLQIKGKQRGITVIDDYAHHPSEIEVTLSAIKESHDGRVVVIFQPHRYSRTKLLFNEFARVLVDTDMLYIMDIYAASEDPIEGVSSELLCQSVIDKGGKNVRYLNGEDMLSTVLDDLKQNDIVLTLGAGNIWAFGEKIVEGLR